MCVCITIHLMKPITIEGIDLEIKQVGLEFSQTRLASLVFLHEGLGSVSMWRDWPAQLCQASGRTGWIYSRQGYGRSKSGAHQRTSTPLSPRYMHHEALDVLPAIVQALSIKAPVLIGHSDGGTIALLYSSQHPTSGCIVMAPHILIEEISINAIKKTRMEFENGNLRQALNKYHEDVDGAFWQWNNVWLSSAFASFDIRPECRNIKTPILAIQGDSDPYGTLAQINQIKPKEGNIQREVLSNCGHSPHKDQSDACMQTIVDFLALCA